MPTLRVVVTDAETTPVLKRRVTVKPYGRTPVYTDGGNTLVEPSSKWVDEVGEALFILPASADLLPTNTPYEVHLPGVRKPVLVEMPAGFATFDIEDVLVDPPGTVESAALSSHRASIDDHADVDLTDNATGRVLMWNGLKFVPANTHATDLEVASAIAVEAEDRSEADLAILAAVEVEEDARIAGDAAEATARTNADATIQANLDAEEDARIAADAAETAARIAALATKAPKTIEVDPVLASAIEADLRPSAHQIVSAPSTLIHGFVRVGEHLFGSHRETPGRLSRFRMDDLSDQAMFVFPADGRHNGADALVYSREKDKLYVVHDGAFSGTPMLVISEVDPHTMTATDFVADSTRWASRGGGGPALAIVDGHLVVVTTPSTISADIPTEIVKYSLVDGAVVDALTLTDCYGGHAVTHDGVSVYAAGSNTEHNVASPAWVVKADLATLTLQTRVVLDAGYDTPTDDICAVGDFLYLGLEVAPGSADGIIQRRRTSDLGLDQNIIVSGVGDAACFGTFWDGRWVWSLWNTSPGLAVLIDPQTLEQRRFTFPAGENSPNEFATDGRRYFFAHWDSGKVSRYTLPTLSKRAASDTAFTPTGAVAATNVQSAIAELDTEKAPVVHGHPFSEITGIAADAQIPATIARDAEVTAAIAAALVEIIRDPLGLGFASTVPMGAGLGSAANPTANTGWYVRLITGGTFSEIGLQVSTQSGNLCIAGFRKTGTGHLAQPGPERVFTTGSVACPAAGYREIDIGGTFTMEAGDYLYLATDNTTAAFQIMTSGFTSGLATPWGYQQASAFPAPTSPSSLVPASSRTWAMKGVT